MNKPIWIKNPLAIFTSNQQDARGGLVVEGDKIIELVALGEIPNAPDVSVYDASEHIVIPGLVNAHHHFYQTLTRAFPAAINKPLFPWLTTLYPVWANLTIEQIEVSTQLALVELLLSGCTTTSDHHYLFTDNIQNAIDVQAETASRLGMRVQLTRGSMSLGQDQGGLPPQITVQPEQRIIDDSIRLIKKYHDPKEGAMIKLSLAPCSPFSVTEELMIESAKIAREFGLTLHTHLAETEDENNFCLKKLKLRPLDYLEKVGWLADDVWLAHGIHFNDDEIQRLGKNRVGICHCPSSNMILASGICRGIELEQAGAVIGLGVDGSASNDGSNMINELRQALLIHRLRYNADQVTHLDILRWATKGSAGCFGRTDIGELAVDKQADLAMFKLNEPRFSGAGDPLAALLLCGAQSADRTMVNGQWRVANGELIDIDLDLLMHKHKNAANQLRASLDC
ncbi:MAG: 8-oxoguanine deaminase [Acidiferrobacterales bacterium]|nr:8-oxoguanine deaminase [Acidiferrobacterales bacterium]